MTKIYVLNDGCLIFLTLYPCVCLVVALLYVPHKHAFQGEIYI
jgi:hypothetical protein